MFKEWMLWFLIMGLGALIRLGGPAPAPFVPPGVDNWLIEGSATDAWLIEGSATDRWLIE